MYRFAIAHCDYDYLVGVEGHLAYKSRADFKEFKKLTNEKLLVVGTGTYKEMGNLPNRNVLCLSSKGNTLNGKPTTWRVEDLDSFVLCGGTKIWAEYLNLCAFVVLNYTNQIKVKPSPNPTYFPKEILFDSFRVGVTRTYGDFTQRIWVKR
jgi:dihydrofolate reductase